MISNERRWPSYRSPQQQQRQPYGGNYYERPQQQPMRPPIHEDTLETRQLQIERKYFLLTLKENPRGRFLRIAEEANGRFNSIIVPASGLHDFQKLLEELVNAATDIPPKAADEPSASPGNGAAPLA